MDSQDSAGVVIIPEGDKISFKSELFDVVVRGKHRHRGLTRDQFLVTAELVEQDPLLERMAVIEIQRDVWDQLHVGDRAKIRLYEQPDQRWTTKMPLVTP